MADSIQSVDAKTYRNKLTEIERLVFVTFDKCHTDTCKKAWELLAKRNIKEFKTFYCIKPSDNDLYRIKAVFTKLAKKHSDLLDIIEVG